MGRLISLVIGYCFGCFLTAEVVARLHTGKSAAQLGTGKPGMANISSPLGWRWGALVLLGDIAKTAVACALAVLLTREPLAVLYAGFGTTLGHNFPFWIKFRGGKGVATTCTSLVLFHPIAGGLCCLAGLAVTLITGWLPLGAVVIPALFIPLAFKLWGPEAGLLAVLSTLMMISRHFLGLKRIVRGEEHKVFRHETEPPI